MTADPNVEVSDQELTSMIELIRQEFSLICGSLGARGLRVTRKRVRSTLRSVDPLGSALRWPTGATTRQPYSVAGPKSLWHINMTKHILFMH